LALANWPAFNPNIHGDASDDQLMDRAVGAAYEPGSTFKLITLASAVAEGIARPSEVVDCQMGSIVVAGRLIHDWHSFGLLTVADVLAHSSDVGAIKIGLRLGALRFYHYIRAFGFGQLTGIELPGENRGLLRRLENWTASSIGSLAMGQEISATPVQMITAVSSIANGGLLCHPHIVREIRWGASVELARVPDPRRSLDATAAATLRQMMEGVVLEGTGKQAALNGHSVAGKTGTAQKIDPATGRYSATQYVASFIGFLPARNPRAVVYVVVDEPHGSAYYGAQVAAPVFQAICQRLMGYWQVPPDDPASLQQRRTARR
jgi:cell division protein FtsI (penicillin-binding protein 3)